MVRKGERVDETDARDAGCSRVGVGPAEFSGFERLNPFSEDRLDVVASKVSTSDKIPKCRINFFTHVQNIRVRINSEVLFKAMTGST